MSEKLPEVVIDAVVTKQVASLCLTNTSVKDIADGLGISQYMVRKIMGSDAFKETLEDIADEATGQAVKVCKARMGDLMGEALRVLMVHLAADSLDAAKEVFKLSGVTQRDDKGMSGPTAIQVILPSAKQEKVVASSTEDKK